MEEGFGPVSGRVTVQDGVYLQLREALLIGRFDPGQVLTIASLSQSFDTSHMPVREALRRLAAENALEIARNGSARVPPVSVARLDDLCRARATIEGLATELATQIIGPEEIDALEAVVAAHEICARDGQVFEMLATNREFHYLIYKASKSEVLIQLIDTLWLRYGPYMRMLSAHVGPRMATEDFGSYTLHHRRIIAAMRQRDAVRAREEMVSDIRDTQDLLRSLIAQ
ncbi:GntR family transcriptional regulator [Rhizobium sp. KVB221]|uniref:GntR family transcriptional regulator n=1 Tax=Rhizobium setariae TaxID=2801340 RepID=A0A937CPH4_9HYPH|nr:GntR family transcriptional regulator [Rhizobium setariae]MBL0372518.1 GntR family transcriptional regulator [Rhizobium setariae]